MKIPSQEIGRFFDALTDDYTATIERCFPRYREMLWAVMDYLPKHRAFDSILELGCGTGNLTILIRDAFPNAQLRVLDVSSDSLAECSRRIDDGTNTEYVQSDFSDAVFPAESFDLVVSSIAIHHVDADTKRMLFGNVYRWLKPEGVLCFSDQCAGETTDLYDRHMENWKSISMKAGSTDEEWEMWMQHQRECDHHDTLADQMEWLRQSEFSTVDCVWRYLLWSVIQARK